MKKPLEVRLHQVHMSWKKLYEEEKGVIGINAEGIHIYLFLWKKLAEKYGNWKVRDNTIGYTGNLNIDKWYAELTIMGTRFYALGTDEEFEAEDMLHYLPTPLTEEEND